MEDHVGLGLPLEIISEDGNRYLVRPFEATPVNVSMLWSQAGKYSFLFSDLTLGDEQEFQRKILSPSVVICSITLRDRLGDEDIGIVYADEIHIGWAARAHYFFWDKIQSGRHRILLEMCRWFMDAFGLHRLDIEIMQYAYSALRRMHKMGVMIEGRKREAVLSKGRWVDLMTFGILRDDLTDDVIREARIPRTEDEDSWFGLLKNGSALAHAVLREDR